MGKYSLLQNILLGLSLAAPIGPVNLEIIKRGLNSGFKQAFLTGAGAMSADTTYLILIFFGLTSFLNNSSLAIVMGVTGSIILLYLGVMNIREFFQKTTVPDIRQKRIFKRSFIAGYALAISSPMTIIWWTGVFGALMASQGPVQTSISAFLSCLSILLGCFLWVLSLAVTLHLGKKILREKTTRIISMVAGLFLVGFGAYCLYRTWMMIKI